MITSVSTKKGEQLSMATTTVSLAFAFLGGSFVPIEYLGDKIKNIGRFVPNYWYTEAVRRIDEGSNYSKIFECFILQLVFGIACLAVGLAINRYREARE